MRTLILLSALLIVSCKQESKTTGANQVDQSSYALTDKIEAQIQHYIALDIFSGVVMVAEKGAPVYHKAFGLADRSTKTPNNLNTLFDIGSMNKTFTSIVVKQLENEGKLNFDDKLIDHIPGFNDPQVSKITIRQLLNHTSGFGDYHTGEYFDLPKSEKTLDAIVERAKNYRLLFEPGSGDEYSNLGYVILGAVIEKVSEKSYFDNVHERIVKPLKLEDTYLQNFDGLDDRIAKGYLYTPLGELEVNDTRQDLPNPDGGFLSTTLDIFKFYHSYYNDTLLLSEDIKEKDPLFQELKTIPEGQATGAAGGFEGFNSVMLYVPSDDLSIIVFANMDEPVAEKIGFDILSLYKDKTVDKPQLPAVQNVRIAFESHGAEYVKANFEELTVNFHPTDPKDFILNMLGYAYLYGANNSDKAIQIFKLNTEMFPDVANCWDSYGEALKEKGDLEAAIRAYEKALEIRPDLESAKEALKTLR
ncbi:MAG: tetratricopeptide repeat protein [Flavobacteriaceae bacterium]|nr:MAG: tetratricopeptide repeat protein [Flavobacteriaceae bacterium]